MAKAAAPRQEQRSLSLFARKEREYLVENLSTLVGSGMNLSQVIQSIREDIKSHAMRRVLAQMATDIESGLPLWQAMQKSELFPDHAIALTRVGEQSGRLAANLKVVAEQEEKDRHFRSKVRSALLYPLFVLALTLIVGIGVAWFVLPRLSSVFDSLDLTLPPITRIIIALGNFIEAQGLYVIPAVSLVLLLGLYLLFGYSRTRWVGQEFLFRLPGVKRLIREVEVARLGYLLGSLLESGLPVAPALASLSRATFARSYKKFYDYLHQEIAQGNSFEKSFASYLHTNRLIPVPMQQLIIASERSGKLPATLIKIGAIYEGKVEATSQNLTVILEPILLVIVWLGVLAVALAVILPLYSLLGGLG